MNQDGLQGPQFDAQAVADQQVREAKAGGIGCLVDILLLAGVWTCSTVTGKSQKPAEPQAESESLRLASYQVGAKDALKAILRDPGSARYEDVRAHAVSEVPGVYAFCGRVNAKNGFGGYSGFERFVAGPGVAATESMVSDFHVVWSRMCGGPGQEVWF